ncbi:class I SAM-dependent methyltransferase [Candidatus Woesearchaeota archaeon]|nr:class I SAM-dependent methyltransferase [Candidatus Woesearchaeota archaeon]
MGDWERLYKEKGTVQREPSKKVLEAIEFFKEKRVKKVLDLGCGTGRHTELLVNMGFEAYGCDNSKDALEIVKRKLPNCRLEACDMTKLPYSDGYFDGVLCYLVIQHGMMKDIKKTVSEMIRVLKKRGYLYLAAISRKHPTYDTGEEIEPNTRINTEADDGDMPHHFFSEDELKGLFDEFEIIRIEHFEEESMLNPDKVASWGLYAMKP